MNQGKKERSFLGMSILVSMGVLALVTLAGMMKHEYWRYVIYEKSPFGAFQGLLLFSCFGVALANGILSYRKQGQFNLSWVILGLSFLYLTLDETLGLHEGIRENILKPHHFKIPWLFWVEPGDYALVLLMLLGILLLPLVVREIRNRRSSFAFFAAAVVFSALAVGVDSIYLKGMPLGMQKSLQYGEAFLETCGMLCYLNSFAVRFFHYTEAFRSVKEQVAHTKGKGLGM